MLHLLRFLTQFLKKKPNAISLVIAFSFAIYMVIHWMMTYSILPCDSNGAGDCAKYQLMAHSFFVHHFQSVEYPFNFRILTPWLASFYSPDISKGFLWINSLSILIFVACWFGIAHKLNFNNIEFSALLLWFFFHPIGFGFYFVSPVSVDPLAYAFLSLISLLFFYEKYSLLVIAVSFSLFVKESFNFILLIIVASEIVFIVSTHKKPSKPTILFIASMIIIFPLYKLSLDFMSRHFFPISALNGSTNIFETMLFWMKLAWHDPKRLIAWIGSFFCATGLFSILLFRKKITPAPQRKDIRKVTYLLLGSLGYILFGILAGSDMSRIIFNGNLLILSLCFFLNNKPRPIWSLIVLSLSLLIALNYTKFIPFTFLEYSYYMSGRIKLIAYFILLNIITLCLLFTLLRIKQR